jgi:hypothetical protein
MLSSCLNVSFAFEAMVFSANYNSTCRPAVCACARASAQVRMWVWWRVLYAQFQYKGIWGFPSAASMNGSLLLVDVWACPD